MSHISGCIRTTLLAASTLLAVTVASPAAAQTPPVVANDSATAKPATRPLTATRQSWTSDRRDFAVGDLITVLIDDYTLTTAIKENSATDTKTRGLALSARLPTSSKNVGLDTRNSADQQQRGSARRENRFQNELSVRVVSISPNGLLELKGTKNINVDKAMQDVVFTGWARPQDISASNMVESARIADAQLGYLSPGNLGKPGKSLVSKLLGAFWP